MNVEGLKPFKWQRWGGDADWDDPSQLPIGVACLCRNSRFRAESVATRYGRKNTMVYNGALGDVSGLDVLNVVDAGGEQIPIVWTNNGLMYQESPAGSGTLVPISPPIIPTGAQTYMQTTQTENRLYMAWTSLKRADTIPQFLDGVSGAMSPVSQNPIGGIWSPGRHYLVGDVVRTTQNPNRWFRCLSPNVGGSLEPSWPTLDGYLTGGGSGIISTSILSCGWSPPVSSGHSSRPALSTATVSSVSGFAVGQSITVAGVSDPNFNGTWTIYSITSNQISWEQSGLVFHESGTGGTMSSGISPNNISQVPATLGSTWVEWSPACPQFLPTPEDAAQVLGIKGQLGAPGGSIPIGQDVYICFSYQNKNGESVWTQPIVYQNSLANDVIEVFFQKQNDNPGPITPAVFNAIGYGGPRMPNWLLSVIGVSNPVLAWPNFNCLNVYVAAVAHGADAPTQYGQYLSGTSVAAPIVISSIPANSQFLPRLTPTAALNSIPFTGSAGPRYFAVERVDLTDSFVPIDPGSPLLVNFTSSVSSSGSANILFIQRSSNIVTCTVDLLAGFAQGSQVVIENVTDTSFNGTFQLTGVSPNQIGGATLLWSQSGNQGASTGGTAITSGSVSAFIVPQIVIGSITRAANVVTAVVNTLQGLAVGTVIQVSGVTDATFDGAAFTILSITPNLGGGGSVTWAQAAGNASSGSGTISVTGAGVGTNTPQNITRLQRGVVGGGIAGQVDCFVLDGSTQLPPGYATGALVTVAGATPGDLNGTFTLTYAGVVTTIEGKGWGLTWQQGGITELATVTGTVTLITQGTVIGSSGNISAITRVAGVVTATLDSIANFTPGGLVNVTGVLDAGFDGAFTVTSVDVGLKQLQWNQPGADAVSSDGSVTQTSGGGKQPAPVAMLPPGGPFVSQDVAVFGVQGGSQAGPFFYVPQQNPIAPFSASIVTISAISGAVTALLSDASGLSPGRVIEITGSQNGWFDGVYVLAQVDGNTIVYAGNGPGTGAIGGTVTLIPTVPTIELAQNDPQSLTFLSRVAAGMVSAQLNDVSFLSAGMVVQLSGVITDPTFNGIFKILTVTMTSTPSSATPLAGTVTWQSETLSASVVAAEGLLSGVPGIVVDFSDDFLSSANDVTPQLAMLNVPPSIDLRYLPSLDRMVWTPPNSTTFWFSNIGDPANVADPGGLLSVDPNNGKLAVCCREMTNGEVIAMKENGGYAIIPNDNTPSGWDVSRRWGGEQDPSGPVGPKAVAVGHNWLVFFAYGTGPHRYYEGQTQAIGLEKQGTWDRCNWDVAEQFWIAIDESKREIHFHVALDGSTFCNHDEVLNYFNGWEDPLTRSQYTDEMIPNRRGRRWSDHDSNSRTGGRFKRTLSSLVDPRIDHYQFLTGMRSQDGNVLSVGVQMEMPDQYYDETLALDDDGNFVKAGIDWQYMPAFAQNQLLNTLQSSVLVGRARGNGTMYMSPTQQNPDDTYNDPPSVDLTTPDQLVADCLGPTENNVAPLPKDFAKGIRVQTPRLGINFNNGAVVDSWAELHDVVLWYKEQFPCEKSETAAFN